MSFQTSEEDLTLIPLVPVGSSKNKCAGGEGGGGGGKNGGGGGASNSGGSSSGRAEGEDSLTVNENWILAECLGLGNGSATGMLKIELVRLPSLRS